MSKLTRKDISNFLKKKYNLSNQDAISIVREFFNVVVSMSKQNGGVVLQNFGKFEFQKKTLEKNVRDFQANNSYTKIVKIERIRFVPSKNLKEKIF